MGLVWFSIFVPVIVLGLLFTARSAIVPKNSMREKEVQ